jgi:hypothetical protein
MAGNRSTTGLNVHTVQEATNLISQRKVIRVTPTLTIGSPTEFGDGDVLLNSTEIPNAVLAPGGCSKLMGVTVVNYEAADDDLELVFTQVDGENIGTINSAPNISDADAKSLKILATWELDASDSNMSLGNSKVFSNNASTSTTNTESNVMPIFLQAEEGATSVYFQAVIKTAQSYNTTSDLEFVFHIEY